MEGVGARVETSGVVGVGVDAVSCLLFDFKDDGPESGYEKDVLEPVFTDKTEKKRDS